MADLSETIADLRLERNVRRLHRLGARPLYELLRELGAVLTARTAIDKMVAEYAALDREFLEAIGADRFPPHPLHLVNGGIV